MPPSPRSVALSPHPLSLREIPGELTRTSLTLRAGLTFDDYQRIANILTLIEGAVQFWWGDLLNHAEAALGEQYAQLVDEKAARTLSNYAWVASKIEPARRRERLSWSHHAEVAVFEPTTQDDWLKQAEEGQWTRAKLRAAIKGTVEKVECECPTCGDRHSPHKP